MRAELMVALLMVTAAALAPAADGPQLQVVLPSEQPTVGDLLTLQVLARGGAGLMWGELSVEAAPGGDWEVVDGPRPLAASDPPAWELTLAPMKVGELELPPIHATVRPADGRATQLAVDGGPTVTVASVLPAGEEPPAAAPLRDPVGVEGLPWEWFLPGIALSLPLALLAAWWWSRRRAAAQGSPQTPVLPPLDELLHALSSLEQRVGRDAAAAVCDPLATGVRRYIERRTGEPALEMTSFELRVLARRAGWPGPVQQGVQRVMAMADGVRFGRRQGTDGELRAAIDAARGIGRALEQHLTPADAQQQPAAEGGAA